MQRVIATKCQKEPLSSLDKDNFLPQTVIPLEELPKSDHMYWWIDTPSPLQLFVNVIYNFNNLGI